MKTNNRAPNPRNPVLRGLLARSGNQCAFPGCAHPIINEKQRFVANVCHIEAASPGGPRYNSAISDEETRSYGNLVLLCYRHHIETDDATDYPVAILRQMKADHEASFADRPFRATEQALAALIASEEQYWAKVEHANTYEHVVPDLRIEIAATTGPEELLDQLRDALARLQGLHQNLFHSAESLSAEVDNAMTRLGYDVTEWRALPYHDNPLLGWNWEVFALGLPNYLARATVLIDQLEIRHLEAALRLDPENTEISTHLTQRRAAFLELSRAVGLAD